jgi:hypothetical protein
MTEGLPKIILPTPPSLTVTGSFILAAGRPGPFRNIVVPLRSNVKEEERFIAAVLLMFRGPSASISRFDNVATIPAAAQSEEPLIVLLLPPLMLE